MSTTPKYPVMLSLTTTERAFLLDRFEAGGALADCMVDTFDDDPDMRLERGEWEGMADGLIDRLKHDGPPVLVDNRWEEELIVDALEGSTLLVRMNDARAADEITRQKYQGYVRVASKLRQYLAQEFGREVDMPNEM